MSLINIIKVSLTFVDREIFSEIGFQVETGDRIGLVGPNGSGKTTLLRLLNGEVSPDKGEVRLTRGVRMGYLSQDVQETLSGPLLRSVLDAVPGRVELVRELAHTERALRDASGSETQSRLAESVAELHQKVSALDTHYPPHEAEKILMGLGFLTTDFDRPVATLSGGWKTRAALASLLYQRTDLLLLDEPTNHLDIPSVRWLEQFLQDFGGALVLVSHDREFLNRQVRRVVSFEPEGMRSYAGNYDFYLKAREEERKLLEAKARKQDQKVKEAQKFIDRFRSKATKARQAQSKLKLLKKIEMVETHKREKTVRFSFPEVSRSGRDVVSLRGIAKGFGGPPLYRNLDLTVLRGERVAIIGANGSGKTTLLRMIAGELEPDEGTVSLGHGVDMGYFAQHHSEMLNPANTILEEVYHIVPNQSLSFVRGVCGAFLFSGGDVDKPVSVLSGGERARVSLARLLVKPGNFMVMDEPTNHLDLSSSEVLIRALADYNGTLLFVSHNQSFVNTLATKIWDIRGGEVAEFPGNLNDYYRHLERMEAEAGKAPSGRRAGDGGEDDPGQKAASRKDQKRERAEQRRRVQDALKPLNAELERVETRIEELETRQGELEKVLADPDLFSDKERSVPLMKEYKKVREEQERLLVQWEKCQTKLEAARETLGV